MAAFERLELQVHIPRQRVPSAQDQVDGAAATVHAIAPLSRLLDFTTRVRSLTQGRGAASMLLEGYREVPSQERDKVLGV